MLSICQTHAQPTSLAVGSSNGHTISICRGCGGFKASRGTPFSGGIPFQPQIVRPADSSEIAWSATLVSSGPTGSGPTGSGPTGAYRSFFFAPVRRLMS